MKFLTRKEWEEFTIIKAKRDALDSDIKDFEIRKATHEIELESKRKDLDVQRKRMDDEFELKEKQVVAAYEDKLSKEITKLEKKHMKEIQDVTSTTQAKYLKDLEEGLKANYEKLSSETTKLHSEGNAQTKAVTDLSMKVIEATGLAHGSKNSEHVKIEHINNG